MGGRDGGEPFILAWVDLALADVERLYGVIAAAPQRTSAGVDEKALSAARFASLQLSRTFYLFIYVFNSIYLL